MRSYLLVRPFGISRPPRARGLHFNGICWDFWEKQPPRARGEDPAAFTALNPRCIRPGRNSSNRLLLPFLQGHRGRSRWPRGRAVRVSSVLSVSLAATCLGPVRPHHPALQWAAAGCRSPSHSWREGGSVVGSRKRWFKSHWRGPGISKQNAATASAAAF